MCGICGFFVKNNAENFSQESRRDYYFYMQIHSCDTAPEKKVKESKQMNLISFQQYRSALFFLFIMTTIFFPQNIYAEWRQYSPSMQAGTGCKVNISELHPTQFTVGYWEIDLRVKYIAGKDAKKIKNELETHIGKIVVGPNGEPYIIDRHHLACIMSITGQSPFIYATVEANFGNMTPDSFWNEMIARKWTFLYDNKGKGPLDPKLLPKTIKDMQDDPYRSLAWAVRRQDGYKKSEEPFSDFKWADFFRTRIKIDEKNPNMEQAIEEAMKICHDAAAKNLPGYIPASN
jgi:hypothetical protein